MIEEDKLKSYKLKLIKTGNPFSIMTLVVMGLFCISMFVYGENNHISEILMFLIVIFAILMVAWLLTLNLIKATLSRYKCLENGKCKNVKCKYPWSSCVRSSKFTYFVCRDFIHDITKEIDKAYEKEGSSENKIP